MTKTTLFLLLMLPSFCGVAQPEPADTVIVPLAETSRIVFTIGNRRDLEVLKHYNFQALFDDILAKIETGDSTATAEKPEEANAPSTTKHEGDEDRDSADVGEDVGHDYHGWKRSRLGKVGQTWQSYNVDFGTNNYLSGDQFPDGSEPYAVRPWGSWYVGINSVQRTRLGKNIYAEWGLGVSWYTFKFQQDNLLIEQDGQALQFTTDTRQADYIKSKLSATFINASLVPVLDFGESSSRKHRMWDGDGGGFRFGLGPYVGYRISSKTKLVYEIDDERKRSKDHDSFYLNNLRYGLRLQLGVRSTDLFINYDLNELFAPGKGPELRAVSFGLIL